LGPGRVEGVPAFGYRSYRRDTLAFCAENWGVGFAIVVQRGYGRRRWLDNSGRETNRW